MDINAVKRAYRRQAPVYDVLFGLPLRQGRHNAAAWANRLPGKRVLEVGVGTGLSLPLYDRSKRIVGIDVSGPMLVQARRRVAAERLDHVVGLVRMDAERLAFEDDSFDLVVAAYVAPVVPNPRRLLAELQRVCVADGDIVFVNHFANTNDGVRGRVEQALSPFSEALGWRPDFRFDSLLGGGTMRILHRKPAGLMGLFTLVHCQNTPADPGELPEAMTIDQPEPRRAVERGDVGRDLTA